MNRIEQTFNELRKNNRKAFVPYIMAGDGGLDVLVDRLMILEKFGATAIEVGIPFSDPVADGPTIQKAGIRALENGTTLGDIIAVLKKGSKTVTVPLILMTYMNPVYSYGIREFVKDIKEAGINGCIIPDLPIEEEDIIAPILEEAGIELIRLATLTSSPERIREIAGRGKGFLYTVTVKGITGVRNDYDRNLGDFLEAVKEISPIPVLAGFGVSSEIQIKELTQYCDGVIVGSKIVELFEKNDLDALEKFMSAIRTETKIG